MHESTPSKVIPFPKECALPPPPRGRPKFACRLGWHAYSPWQVVFRKETIFDLVIVQERTCQHCNLLQSKRHYHRFMGG